MKNLNGLAHTIDEQLKFGLPEDQAIKARERRVKGVLMDAIKELKEIDLNQEVEGYIIRHPGKDKTEYDPCIHVFGLDAKILKDQYYEGFNPVMKVVKIKDN